MAQVLGGARSDDIALSPRASPHDDPAPPSNPRDQQSKAQGITTSKLFLVGGALVLVAIAANFALTFAAVEMSKDVKVENGKLVSAENGNVLETASGEQSKVERIISSVMADSVLVGLEMIQLIASDGVSKLYMDVKGLMRVETPGSKCGTVVNFYTNLGMVTFDEANVIVDSVLAGRLAEDGFRLASDAGINASSGANQVQGTGLFTSFDSQTLPCTPSAGPKVFVKPYRAQMIQYHHCLQADLCVSRFKDKEGANMKKAGYDEPENAIISTLDAYESDTHFLRLTKFQNFPMSTWVEVVDFANSIHSSYALDVDGTAHSCTTKTSLDMSLFATDIDADYHATFNGYKEGPGGARSLREFTMLPKDISVTPAPFVYTEHAEDQKPYSIDLPNKHELEVDVGLTIINQYSQMAENDVTAAIAPYLSKVCAPTQEVDFRPVAKEDSFEENLDTVLHYIDKIDEEFADTVPFPYSAVTNKYGSYWSTLMELWSENEHFYLAQADSGESNSSSNTSRRLDTNEDNDAVVQSWADDTGDVIQFISPSLSKDAADALLRNSSSARRLWSGSGGVTKKVPLKRGCEVAVKYGTDGSQSCFAVESDSTCGRSPPGWYTSGGLEGCLGGGQTSLSGELCIGYSWGFKIKKKLKFWFWSKTLRFGCDLSVYGCLGVSSAYYETARGRRRRRRRRNKVFGATFGSKIGVSGECDFGVKVSVEGNLEFTTGPCGRSLNNKGELAVKTKGCLKIGPFKGCIGFPKIKIWGGDMPDC